MFYYYRLILFFLILFFHKTLSSTGRYGRRRGDVILGGLFPVHEYGSPREPCGAISQFRGIQRLEAMLFAIEQINNDKQLLPGIELGALILDTCSDDNYALEQSLRFVRSRLASGTCTCVNTSTSEAFHNDYVFGVVGATLSSVSVHVANLLRLFQLPQISYASTTPKLSEPSFDYFARTVPSDSNQARAIVDILQRLNFTYVNTIYSHGDLKLSIKDVRKRGFSKKQTFRNGEDRTDTGLKSVLVFHPSFLFWRDVFKLREGEH